MTITPIEVAVVAGAFLLFSFIPGVLAWTESLRRRRAEAVVSIAAPSLGAAPLAPVEISAAPVAGPVGGEPSLPESTEAPEPVAPVTETPAPAATRATVEDQGAHTFRLDDLRHARALETPPRAVLDDPAAQRQWEEGLALVEKTHAVAIGNASLSASFEPQARCFAGMNEVGDGVKQLRFFLFTSLWPTAVDQAAGEAVFEIGEAGLVRGYAVRRQA